MIPEVKRSADGASKKIRLSLALSGGGFRASIFHLGVIRRLEELGIMKDVDVISAVSGGSIIAAYYVCEMEQRLRELEPNTRRDTSTRVRLFEEIADGFLEAVDHNLRTRAIVFTPFFHPLLFVKTLILRTFRPGARAELIQREYDKWFYDGDTIDQLPSVTPEQSKGLTDVLYGPKVILNTTSLLTGERVAFSREPTSAIAEMRRSNRNSLPLSRVVGASSGVPVLFPPTYIYGDPLVDGGVADNQGIEALLPDLAAAGSMAARSVKGLPPPKPAEADTLPHVLLVSDASGQLEAVHTINTGETSVFLRVTSILQYQVRSKLIDRLVQWKESQPNERAFAFTHLFLNLKDRGVTHRLPSELIPSVARIRTDLDQFSYVEREALMYHGYTLIDAQIRQYCEPVLQPYLTQAPPLTVPPLFTQDVRNRAKRDSIRTELEAGAQKVFLLRSLKKYPRRVGLVLALWAVAWAGALWILFSCETSLLQLTQGWIKSALSGITSGWIGVGLDWLLAHANLPPRPSLVRGLASLLGSGALAVFAGYALAFPTYLVIRVAVLRADRRSYYDITNKLPTTHWPTSDGADKARPSVNGPR